jgi:hypothetical protein
MLINLSNHSLESWSAVQRKAATVYGETIDLPFPNIDPWWSDEEIAQLADAYEEKVLQLFEIQSSSREVVHLMGEMTFCFALLKKLQKRGISCVASTSERVAKVDGQSKISEFRFCRFREYPQ